MSSTPTAQTQTESFSVAIAANPSPDICTRCGLIFDIEPLDIDRDPIETKLCIICASLGDNYTYQRTLEL